MGILLRQLAAGQTPNWISPFFIVQGIPGDGINPASIICETTIQVFNPNAFPVNASVDLFDWNGEHLPALSTVLNAIPPGGGAYFRPNAVGVNASGSASVKGTAPIYPSGWTNMPQAPVAPMSFYPIFEQS
jgi:hypothetical protein